MHFLILIVSLFLNLSLYAFAEKYQIIDLGILDKDSSEIQSLNNKSEVCGVYYEGRNAYAYVWSREDSNHKSFKSPHKIFITDSSIIYGSYYNWVSRGTWDLDQETIYKWENPFRYFTYFNCDDIGYPPTLFSTGHCLFTVALWDVNDQGQLLVMDNDKIYRNNKYEIWVYNDDKFDRINNEYLNAAIRINNQSQILGFYFEDLFSGDGEPLGLKGRKTVIYDLKDGQVRVFNTPGESWGEDINDLGEVVGVIKEASGAVTGFFGTPDQLVQIPDFSPNALNNCGQIIGKILKGPHKNAPAIWENGKLIPMKQLISLIDDKGNGWDRIDVLTAINDRGEIVGQGVYKGMPHGFLLIPLD